MPVPLLPTCLSFSIEKTLYDTLTHTQVNLQPTSNDTHTEIMDTQNKPDNLKSAATESLLLPSTAPVFTRPLRETAEGEAFE